MNSLPYADLQTFNVLTSALSETVNVHLNDPFADGESLQILQGMIGKAIEIANDFVKRKMDRALAQQIAQSMNVPSATSQYYSLPDLPEVSPELSKRKFSTFQDDCVHPVTPDNFSSMTSAPLLLDTPSTVASMIPPVQFYGSPELMGNAPFEDGWTNLNIRRLRSFVSQLGENWMNVAVHMNCGLTPKQCSDKWMQIKNSPEIGQLTETEAILYSVPAEVNPIPSYRMVSLYKDWCTYEIIYLKELVARHQVRSNGRVVINWGKVSEALNRPEQDCRDRWQYICSTRVKKGPYKREEDEIILQRIAAVQKSSTIIPTAEGDELGSEVWDQLGRELGRPAKNIRLRWRSTLNKKAEERCGSVSSSSSTSGTGTYDGHTMDNNNGRQDSKLVDVKAEYTEDGTDDDTEEVSDLPM